MALGLDLAKQVYCLPRYRRIRSRCAGAAVGRGRATDRACRAECLLIVQANHSQVSGGASPPTNRSARSPFIGGQRRQRPRIDPLYGVPCRNGRSDWPSRHPPQPIRHGASAIPDHDFYSAPSPAQIVRAGPAIGSDRGRHDLASVVRPHCAWHLQRRGIPWHPQARPGCACGRLDTRSATGRATGRGSIAGSVWG